jgi:osmotically-inducible protein OsmY
MKMRHALTALLAAGALSLAHAQAPAAPPAQADLANQPVASVSRADATADAIVQALIAEDSMKGSKITVQPHDGGHIVLTGVTPTRAQVRTALEIATEHAGQGKVANALTTEELYVNQGAPDSVGAAPAESREATEGTATPAA